MKHPPLVLPNSEGGIAISFFLMAMYPFGLPAGKLYDRNGN